MSGFWDFLGGASNYLLTQRQQESSDKRDLERAKALEVLRRETSDYEYNRGRSDALKRVDAQQSYLDAATKQYVMVNSEGQEIGRRAATTSEIQAQEAGTLKLEDMRTDIAYKKKQMSLLGQNLGGGGRGGLDSRPSKEEERSGKVQALAASVISNLRRYNLPQNYIAKAEAIIRARINSGQADEAWLRRFEAAYLASPEISRTLTASSTAAAADEILGNALKN